MRKYFEDNEIDEEVVEGETGTIADMVEFPDPETLPPALKFEGTADDLDRVQLDFTESYDNASAHKERLREAAGVTANVIDYINSNPENPSYEDFNQKGFNTSGADYANFRGTYNYKARQQGLPPLSKPASGSTGPVAAASVVDERPDFDLNNERVKSDPTYKLIAKLYQAAADGEDEVNSVEEIVEEKFQKVYDTAYRVATHRATKAHAFICGDAGIGKSYSVTKAIEAGLPRNKRHPQLVNVHGSVGNSLAQIVLFFFKNRNNKLIVLDDADGFIMNKDQNIQNFLKAILDPDGHPVTIPNSTKAYLDKILQRESAAAMSESTSKIDKFGRVKLFESIPFDEEDEDEFMDEDDYDEEDKYIEIDEEIPLTWSFNSSVILISNLMMSDVNDAVRSRCDCCEITLTREEFVCRAKQILATLNISKSSDVDPELLTWAKKYTFGVFEAVVIANGFKGFNVPINIPLQFRMFSTLAGALLARYDNWCDKNGIPEDTLDKKVLSRFEDETLSKFIRFDLKPLLAGDTRSNTKRR